jgi:hypothetical protein
VPERLFCTVGVVLELLNLNGVFSGAYGFPAQLLGKQKVFPSVVNLSLWHCNSEFLTDGLQRFSQKLPKALVKSLRLNFGRF